MYRWILPLLLCAGALPAELVRRARQSAGAEPGRARPGGGAPPGYLDDGSSAVSDGRAARHFRTTCRCEKIWNCPKLQITVPRCPNEYFLCCD